jgi:hypothetical protein
MSAENIEINIEQLKEDLIVLYEKYIEHGSTQFVKDKADKIYTDCKYATNILDDSFNDAIGPLDAIAWPEIIEKTHRPGMTKERAKKILENLKR